MKLKFFLARILAVLISAVPAVGYAAYNDVTLGSSAVISVAGVTLNVTAPSAVLESISISGDTITVIMPGSSYLKLTSTGRRTLSAPNRSSVTQTSTCTDSLATDVFQTPSAVTSSLTFTISVDAGTCTTGGTLGGSGGGGGGGGGSGPSYTYVPPSTTQTPTTATPTAVAGVAVSTSATKAISGNVDRLLTKGMTNSGVKTLQQILNNDPDTRIAETGSGSRGNESDYFGSATQKAVQRFQVKYGIAKPGTSGYGNVGPLTRTILNSLAGKTVAPATPANTATPAITPASAVSVLGTISRTFKKGSTNADVRILQQILNSDPDTRIAETGSGSPGSESTFFGPATLKAVKKFQEKYGLSGQGQQGYGDIGPKTRTKLNEVSAKTGGVDKQVEDAMKQIKVLQDQLKTTQ